MRRAKALGLFSTLLANKATAKHLQATLESIPDLDARFEFLNLEDYARYPAPRWARLTNPWHSQYLFKQKFGSILQEPADLVFVNAWEFAVPLSNASPRIRAAMLLDSVPFTVHEQLSRRGDTSLRRRAAFYLQHRSFRRAARDIHYFFPMGSDCADALVQVYGVPRDRCFVTLAPQDVESWRPAAAAPPHDPFRLLFVGNDFARKGGMLLLEAFARFLAGRCSLTIVSNDKALEQIKLPSGAVWVKGKSKSDLLEIYQTSDLFVFPTCQDYMPQVLAEALTVGLPVIATAVGGIPDLVHDGTTGRLMPFGSSVEAWATAIRQLADDPESLQAMRAHARSFAEEKLTLERFSRGIRDGIATILSER